MTSVIVGDTRIALPNFEEAATWFRRYRAMGFDPIHWTVDPSKTTGESGKDGKGPIVREWNTKEYLEPVPCERQYHLGLKTGAEIMQHGEGTKRFLICVDVDDVSMQAAIEANLPPTPLHGGKEASPKAHLFYSVDELPNSFRWVGKRADGTEGCLLELISINPNGTCNQVMVAPSHHYKTATDVIWAKQDGDKFATLQPEELPAPAEVATSQLYKGCTAALMLVTGGAVTLSKGKNLPMLYHKKDPERALALTKASILAEDEDGHPKPREFDGNEAKRIIDHAVWELEKVQVGNVQTAMNALVFTAASLLAGSAPKADVGAYLEELRTRCLEVYDTIADKSAAQNLNKWEYTIDRAIQQGVESPRKRCLLMAYKCTDQGAADLLAAEWRGSYRYVSAGKHSSWHCWNGSLWKKTTADQLIRDTAPVFRWATAEALLVKDKEWSEGAVKHYFKQERKERAAAAVSLLRAWVGENGLAVPEEAMDADPWIFNCANGTFDIRKGELREFKRGDLCTKTSQFRYIRNSKPPEKLLTAMRKAFSQQPDGEACVKYMLRWFGYLSTGDTSEQKLMVLHGGGQNGKTSLLSGIVMKVLGEYADNVMKQTLLEMGGKSAGTAPEITALRGQRFGLFSEIGMNEYLDEARVKQLTGADSIKVRGLYENASAQKLTCKFIMDVNYMPKIRGSDFGILRRIRPVPYTRQLPEEEKVKGFAEDILATEGDAVLSLILDEAHTYSKEGLGADPECVRREMELFAQDNDVVGGFLEEMCELDETRKNWGADEDKDMDMTADALLGPKKAKIELSKFTVGADELYQSYRKWANDGGYLPLNIKNFKSKLLDKGWSQPRGPSAKVWNGIRLRPPPPALSNG